MADNVDPKFFEPAEHVRRQMWKALRMLKEQRGLSFDLLADLAGCPAGTFRKYVPEDYYSSVPVPGHYWEQLRLRLWLDYRVPDLYQALLPGGLQLTTEETAYPPNGLQDEQEEGSIACGRLAVARRSGDPDLVDDVADTLETLVPRLRAEARDMRAQQGRRPVVRRPAPASGGDGYGPHEA